MKKHAMTILIGFCLMLLAATVWICMRTGARVNKLANAVKTQAGVLNQHLHSPEESAGAVTDFQSGEILNQIRNEWSRAPEVPARALPVDVLQPSSRGTDEEGG